VLLGSGTPGLWSKRAATEIDQARNETTNAAADALVVERDNTHDRTIWWTFAGLLGNAEIATTLPEYQSSFDNFAITMTGRMDFHRVAEKSAMSTRTAPGETGAVKFQECLPPRILAAMQQERCHDHDAAAFVRLSSMLWRERV
jgi:hypothetical protein